MSTTDDTTDDLPTLEGPRVCPECEGFGAWHGDRSRGELVVECVNDGCSHRWTAPDLAADD